MLILLDKTSCPGKAAVSADLTKIIKTFILTTAFALLFSSCQTPTANLNTSENTGPITSHHPIVLMSAVDRDAIREAVKTSRAYRSFFDVVLVRAKRAVKSGPPDYQPTPKTGNREMLWQRDVGNTLSDLAMAYAISRDPVYLKAATTWSEKAMSYPAWGYDLWGGEAMDLAAGHLLFGLATVYDWCFDDLTPEIRNSMRTALMARGQKMFAGSKGQAHWFEGYLQNHLWVSIAGLAAAGFAIEEADPSAKAWIDLSIEKFQKSVSLLPADGGSQEGPSYWEYGLDYMLRFMQMAKDRRDADLFRSEFFKNTARYAMYFSTFPSAWTAVPSSRFNFGFADTKPESWYGPSFIFRKLAHEYKDGYAQGLADALDEKHVSTPKDCWLNLLWYDPALKSKPIAELPHFKFFNDHDFAVSRTGWDDHGSMVIYKSGNPLGDLASRPGFPFGNSASHVHPDAGSFGIFANDKVLIRSGEYLHLKETAYENTLRIDDQGQIGEGDVRFRFENASKINANLKLVRSDEDVDYLLADATHAYDLASTGLKEYRRQFIYLKKERVLIVISRVRTSTPKTLQLDFQPGLELVSSPADAHSQKWESKLDKSFALQSFDTIGQGQLHPTGAALEDETSAGDVTLTMTAENTKSWDNITVFSWAQSANAQATVLKLKRNAGHRIIFGLDRKEIEVDPSKLMVKLHAE